MTEGKREIKELCSGTEIVIATTAVVTAIAEAPRAVKAVKDVIKTIEGK